MLPRIDDIVKTVNDLVSFPEVYLKVTELIDNPGSSSVEIAQLISQDPALTLHLLHMANSPFYGVSGEVNNINRAISILGLKQIKQLILSTSASKVLAGIPNDLFVMDDFWHHSVTCGLIAQYLALECDSAEADFAFVAGMLHDIGQLVYFNLFPGQAKVVLEQLMEAEANESIHYIEQRVFGFDHAQLGGALLKAWNLPPLLQECVEYHHAVEGAQNFRVEAAIIHIANALSHIRDVGLSIEDAIEQTMPLSWEVTGLSKHIIEPAVEDTDKKINEIRSLLGLGD